MDKVGDEQDHAEKEDEKMEGYAVILMVWAMVMVCGCAARCVQMRRWSQQQGDRSAAGAFAQKGFRRDDKKKRSLADIATVNEESEQQGTRSERRPSIGSGSGPSYGAGSGPSDDAEDSLINRSDAGSINPEPDPRASQI